MKFKKAISILCSLALMAGALLCLTSCGPKNEEIIRQSLTDEFDAYKNLDDEVMTELTQSIASLGLDRLGIDNEEFVSVVLDGFDYSIDNVVVNGKQAVATMTFSGKSFDKFQESLNDVVTNLTTDTSIATMTNDERLEYLGNIIMNAFESVPVVTETVDIEYELKNNVWESTNSDQVFAALDNIVLSSKSFS